MKKSNSRSAMGFFRFMADTIDHAVDNGKLGRACFFKFQAVAYLKHGSERLQATSGVPRICGARGEQD